MKDYLDQRLQKLRKKYQETGETKWLHRFNECRQIREKFTINQMNKTQNERYDPNERA